MGKLKLEQLRAGLATRRIGRRIETHDTVDSTNRLAWARAEEGDADGLAVLAEYQTQGRGRLGPAVGDATRGRRDDERGARTKAGDGGT